MGRQEKIARSIVRAIVKHPAQDKRPSSTLAVLLSLFSAFFALYRLVLRKIRPLDFANLRQRHWDVSDDDYIESFRPDPGSDKVDSLKAIGDMGFSGSVSIGGLFVVLMHATDTDFCRRRPSTPLQTRNVS